MGKYFNCLIIVLMLGIGISVPVHASAVINPGAMLAFLDNGKGSVLKRIYNVGTSTAFVKVVVMEIIYDAAGKATELAPKPLSSLPLAEQDTLVASPARMIIPANGMQSTRLLFIGARSNERYYRVRFIPVLPTSEQGFVLSPEELDAYKEKIGAELTVLTGYGTILIVRPDTLKFDTQIKETASDYSIRNEGNSAVVLDYFKGCNVGDSFECSATTQHYILPKRTYQFVKEKNKQYTFVLKEGAEERKIVVN